MYWPEGALEMITSASNGRVKWVVSLMEKARMRRKERKYVVEGIRMFMEAPPELIAEVYISKTFSRKAGVKGSQEEACLRHLEERKKAIPEDFVTKVSDDVFRKFADTVNPQGILAVMDMAEVSPDKMLETKKPLLVLLENLQDPGNLGTILRTAEGAGVNGIVLSRDCVDLYNPKVIRSTMGAIYRVPFLYTEDLTATMRELQNRSIPVYAAALDEKAGVYDSYDYNEAAAFLIGNEGNGLTQEAIAAATHICYIPMEGQAESLNASVAASILMYEAYRQRRTK